MYWDAAPFYGLGVGAASYIGGERMARGKTISEYAFWLAAGSAAQAYPTTPPEGCVED